MVCIMWQDEVGLGGDGREMVGWVEKWLCVQCACQSVSLSFVRVLLCVYLA
jgi:hypothetical protein